MRASEKQKPPWFWTGVMPLDGMEDDSRLRELVAMLPARKSSDRAILTYLVDLRARFPRWMHQDEFGPDRGEQTAALRALMKSCRALQKHLLQRSSTFKAPLDATLRARNNPNSLKSGNETRTPHSDAGLINMQQVTATEFLHEPVMSDCVRLRCCHLHSVRPATR